MPLYNKLVRDLIPQVIEKSGKQFTTRILEDEEYIMELRKKLQEEVQEYLEADNDKDSLEELADLMELIHTLTKHIKQRSMSWKKFVSIRQKSEADLMIKSF